MIDSSEKHNHQLAFELQNLHVCEKRSNLMIGSVVVQFFFWFKLFFKLDPDFRNSMLQEGFCSLSVNIFNEFDCETDKTMNT